LISLRCVFTYRAARDAAQNAVLQQQVVRLSVRDVEVS